MLILRLLVFSQAMCRLSSDPNRQLIAVLPGDILVFVAGAQPVFLAKGSVFAISQLDLLLDADFADISPHIKQGDRQ